MSPSSSRGSVRRVVSRAVRKGSICRAVHRDVRRAIVRRAYIERSYVEPYVESYVELYAEPHAEPPVAAKPFFTIAQSTIIIYPPKIRLKKRRSLLY